MVGNVPAGGQRSAPILPPGRKPAPSVPVRETSPASLDPHHSHDTNSMPPSPKVYNSLHPRHRKRKDGIRLGVLICCRVL